MWAYKRKTCTHISCLLWSGRGREAERKGAREGERVVGWEGWRQRGTKGGRDTESGMDKEKE